MTDAVRSPGPGLWGRAANWRFRGFFLAALWLVFLSESFTSAWKLRDSARGDGALLALVAFSVIYVWHFMVSRRYAYGSMPDQEREPSRFRWLSYASLLTLALLTTALIGQSGGNTWVFLAVAGLWTMPPMWAYTAGAALAISFEVLSRNLDGWTRDSSLSIAIVLAMLAVSSGMLAARRTRDLMLAREENARMAIEEERARLARDVHDILGHSLTVITVKAELAGRLMDVDVNRARAEIVSLEALSREALADVRRTVVGFREISLPGELARARQALADAGVQADVPTAVDAVSADLKELFAWAVREGVTNVIRHAGATRCTVTLGSDDLRIADDGTGDTDAGDGSGLHGLRERARVADCVVNTRRLNPGFELVVTRQRKPAA